MNYNLNVGYGRLRATILANKALLGRTLIVMKSDDTNFDAIADMFKVNPDGEVQLFTTIAGATGAQQSGDTIIIGPGTYAESITDALTNVKLIGVGANQVIIAPTISNAYAGAINDSLIKGITFRTPSDSNVTFAALSASDLIGSRITECYLEGTTDPANVGVGTIGIRIGAETDGTWEEMRNSSIDHNIFRENGGRTKELSIAICFGNTDDTDNNASRVFRHSQIADNMICAEFYGIKLNTANANNNGAVITRNFIHSMQGGVGGCQVAGIKQMVEKDGLCMVTDNRIVAAPAGGAIVNMNAPQVQGNFISENGGAVASETGHNT